MENTDIKFIVPMEDSLIKFIREELPIECDYVISTLNVLFSKHDKETVTNGTQTNECVVLQKEIIHRMLVPMIGKETSAFLNKIAEMLNKPKKRGKKVSFLEGPDQVHIVSNDDFIQKRKKEELCNKFRTHEKLKLERNEQELYPKESNDFVENGFSDTQPLSYAAFCGAEGEEVKSVEEECREVIFNRVNSSKYGQKDIYNYAKMYGPIENVRMLNKAKYLIIFGTGEAASKCVGDMRPVCGDGVIKKYFNVYSPEMTSHCFDKNNVNGGHNNNNFSENPYTYNNHQKVEPKQYVKGDFSLSYQNEYSSGFNGKNNNAYQQHNNVYSKQNNFYNNKNENENQMDLKGLLLFQKQIIERVEILHKPEDMQLLKRVSHEIREVIFRDDKTQQKRNVQPQRNILENHRTLVLLSIIQCFTIISIKK